MNGDHQRFAALISGRHSFLPEQRHASKYLIIHRWLLADCLSFILISRLFASLGVLVFSPSSPWNKDVNGPRSTLAALYFGPHPLRKT